MSCLNPKVKLLFFVDAQTLEACILHQEQKAAQCLTHKQCFAKFSLGLFQQMFKDKWVKNVFKKMSDCTKKINAYFVQILSRFY